MEMPVTTRAAWPESDIAILLANAANPRICFALLADRRPADIRAFAKRRGIEMPLLYSFKKQVFWTTDELLILRTYYEVFGDPVCRSLLPTHSYASIYERAHRLGLNSPYRQGRWTSLALRAERLKPLAADTLRSLYSDEGIDGMMVRYPLLSRELHEDHCVMLGLLPPQPRHRSQRKFPPQEGPHENVFTQGEDEILKANYPWAGAMITSWLPNKSLDEITARAKHLKIKGPSARRQARV